jgi:2-oxoglutarate dehydrogenase E1 component
MQSSDFENQKQSFKRFLDGEFALVNKLAPQDAKLKDGAYSEVKSGVKKAKLQELAKCAFVWPENFAINPKLAKLLEQRKLDALNNSSLDWGIVETLAFASILDEGKNIRLSGEDVGRGTFSHRHCVLHSQLDDSKTHVPLNYLNNTKQGRYVAFDSLLSEFAVLGFEYGYSLEESNSLVIWEAQFGDFANGAQTIIDQFICSGESKWKQQSDVVLLLPHGYEGQGPEHSSARVERFLSLAARDNMIVAMPSNPASYFHLLRRHALQKIKKPLVIFTPKSLLRHRLAVCNLNDIDESMQFSPIIETKGEEKVDKVIFCSGKVYYDLIERSSKKIAIIRLEQFYPFPQAELEKALSKYSDVTNFIWCQEEPKNMGAYTFARDHIQDILTRTNKGASLKYVGREDEASPATGYLNTHNDQQNKLIQQALSI